MERQFQINWPTIVEEAKQRRKKLRMTQQRLALLARVSTPTISRFENNDKDIQLFSVWNILHVLGMIDPHQLNFPQPEPMNLPDREVIRFWGKDGDKRICCEISYEALDDFYANAINQDRFKLFKANQSAIEHEARRKYIAGRLEENGSVLITTKDL